LPVLPALIAVQFEPSGHGAYGRVARVLSRVVRASRVVACRNSVVRMHPARHRTWSPALLDRKRRYWNCRAFAEGKREGHCPDEHLGLPVLTYDWWELRDTKPQELKEKLSSRSVAA
jgi:hypothetical protein